jgi:DNA-binding CsgD family transcriptional regulator
LTHTSAAFAASAGRATLLEREDEIAALRTVVAEAAGGRARVVILEGDAGIGKTRLLAEGRRLAGEADLRLLSARGSELEREFAFGVVRQLFEPVLESSDGAAFTGAAGAARRVFEFDLDEQRSAVEAPSYRSFASLHGLYWLVVNLSAVSPLVIAVDDLHWCDGPSLHFLGYLARRLEGLPVLVMGTLRPLQRLDSAPLDELAGDALTVSIRLGPLSTSAAARLVGERLGDGGDDVFGAACHAVTGGNPLLLHELLKTLAIEGVRPDAAHVAAVAGLGPRAASRAVLLRLARLSEEAVKMARAAAVLGDDADLSMVATLAGTELEAAGEAVSALVRAEVLRDGLPLGFVHPLVGAAVHDDMSTVERALAHERAARLLAASSASAERVAAHLIASPARGEEWVIETLSQAARSSLDKGAAESAVTYLTRALGEPPSSQRRARLLLELGRAEALTSGMAAVEHLSEAYELLTDQSARAGAAQILVRAMLLTGPPAEAARLASRAVAELSPEQGDLRRELEALEVMSMLFGGSGDGGEALGQLRRHRQRPVGPGLGAKMLAAVAAQDWMLQGGNCDDCSELALEALAGGELIAADSALMAMGPMLVLAVAGREEALEQLQISLAHAHRSGSLLSKKSVTLWRGFTHFWRGELAEADNELRSSGEGRWGTGVGWLYHHALLSAILRERGDLIAARTALEGSADPGDRSEPTRYWLYSRLELLVAEGRFEQAHAAAEEMASRFAHLDNPVDTPWRSPAAIALHHTDRGQRAKALATDELEHAQRWGAPGTVARALRVLGTLEGDPGLERLRRAAELAGGSSARLEHAKALTAWGAALRRARRPSEAREPLRRALELTDVLGARAQHEQVRTELLAAGGRPRTSALSGVGSLTPSERRVTALVADGYSNREVAEALFVTPKTVEMHLGNAYRKLGARSRHDLPGLLQNAGRGTDTP